MVSLSGFSNSGMSVCSRPFLEARALSREWQVLRCSCRSRAVWERRFVAVTGSSQGNNHTEQSDDWVGPKTTFHIW